MPGNERYLAPGVYVSEIPMGGEPLQPAGSAAAGMVMTAEWGPMDVATLVTSWTDFVRTFGNDTSNGYGALGARDFFRLGGNRLWVARTSHHTDQTEATSTTAVKATITVPSSEATPQTLFTVTAKYYGTLGNDFKVVISDVDAVDKTFMLSLWRWIDPSWKRIDRFTYVGVDSADEVNFMEDKINDVSAYIVITNTVEDVVPAAGTYTMIGGTDGIAAMDDNDHLGDSAGKTGLYQFDSVPEILGICHPGITSTPVIIGGQAYVRDTVARRQHDVYVFDFPLATTPAGALALAQDSYMSTGYEAAYYPWVDEGTTEKPVSPYMLGVWAKNDYDNGVWHAPAGTAFELPISGLEYDLNFGDLQTLNPEGINSIFHLKSEGFVPWGDRTLDVQTHFRYLNIRRFLNVIKKTLQDGTNQFIFEPNAPNTWARIEDTARLLMMYYYSLGAFSGKTIAESFYVKCDISTNPPELTNQGICTCVIGVNFVKPIEFLEFEVQIYNDGVLPIATTAGA